MLEKIKKIFTPYRGLPKEVYVIFIAKIINAVGLFIFPLLTLILTKKIGMSESEAGLWVAITGLVFMPASLIGGKLADTIGRKKIIIIFDTLAAITYIASAFVEPSMEMVYLIILSGTFMGISDPAHNALIADVTTPKNRDGAYSLTYMGFNIGFAVGPILGGLLFENHLRLMFIGDAITALFATALVFFFIGETIEKTKEDLGEDREMEQRVEGSIFKVILQRPILIYFSLISFGYNLVYSQWGFMMPIHVEQNFVGEGAKIYGLLASFNGIIVMVATPLITSLLIKQRNIRKVFYGGIFYTIGFGLLGYISTKTAFISSVLIFTIGEIIITISFMPFINNHTPASHRGRMNSVLPLLMGLGYTVGPILMGKIISISSIEKGWQIIGVIMLISTIFMKLLEKMDNKNA